MAQILLTTQIKDSYGLVFTGTVRIYYSYENGCCSTSCNGQYLAVRVVGGVAYAVDLVAGWRVTATSGMVINLPDNTVLQIQFVPEQSAVESRVCKCKQGVWTLSGAVELGHITQNLSESSSDTNSFLRDRLLQVETALSTANTQLAAATQSLQLLLQSNAQLSQQVIASQERVDCLTTELMIANFKLQTYE